MDDNDNIDNQLEEMADDKHQLDRMQTIAQVILDHASSYMGAKDGQYIITDEDIVSIAHSLEQDI